MEKPKRFHRVRSPLNDLETALASGLLVLKEQKLNDHINYKVRAVKRPQIIIKESRQAYFELRNNWNDEELAQKRRYKALVLNIEDELICEVSFEWTRQLKRDDLKSMISILAKFRGAKVILGKNHTSRNILPTEEEKKAYNQFKRLGERKKIEVKDQIIMSNAECFYFSVNGL